MQLNAEVKHSKHLSPKIHPNQAAPTEPTLAAAIFHQQGLDRNASRWSFDMRQ